MHLDKWFSTFVCRRPSKQNRIPFNDPSSTKNTNTFSVAKHCFDENDWKAFKPNKTVFFSGKL